MHLNKTQWLLIWLTTVACLVLWLLSSNPEPKAFIMPGLLVGGLFVWQASQGEERS